MPPPEAASLLGPAVALCGWTLAMEVWLYARRIPAVIEHKVSPDPFMTKEQLNAAIPRSAQWAADNFTHLCEQPTQYYATIFALVHLHAYDGVTVGLAWMYVGLRIAHSLVQATRNPVMIRFRLFASSSLVLLGLTVRAVQYLM